MHEWALAESVLEAVAQELERRGATEGSAGETGRKSADENTDPAVRVGSVTILFGELQQIDEAIFTEGLRSLSAEYDIPSEVFSIEHEPARFRCNSCGAVWSLRDSEGLSEDELEAIHFLPETAHLFMSCPGCGGNDFAVTAGRGVSISEIRTESMIGDRP
jgi:hydrogenase nickel incorporation protein HypA/HybF